MLTIIFCINGFFSSQKYAQPHVTPILTDSKPAVTDPAIQLSNLFDS